MQKIDWLLVSNFVLVKSNIGLLSVDSNRKSWKIGRTGPKIVDLVRFYLSLLYQLRNPLSKHFSWKLMYSYIYTRENPKQIPTVFCELLKVLKFDPKLWIFHPNLCHIMKLKGEVWCHWIYFSIFCKKFD